MTCPFSGIITGSCIGRCISVAKRGTYYMYSAYMRVDYVGVWMRVTVLHAHSVGSWTYMLYIGAWSDY